MLKRIVSGTMLPFLLIGMLTLAFNIQPAKAEEPTIYIRADGSIDPPEAPIVTYDYVTYTLSDNITSSADGIVVERDNIVVDGAGRTLQGTLAYPYIGIILNGRRNVTIKNMEIRRFDLGLWLNYSSYNTFSGNNITNNGYGVWLKHCSDNSLTGNNITANDLNGVGLGDSSNNSLTRNNITANKNDGIFFYGSFNNSLTGNNITANNQHGISLDDSSNNSLTRNNVVANNRFGIWLDSSNNNSFSENDITANNEYGISLSDSSHNTLLCNIASDNGWTGIQLGYSSYNRLVNNTASNNGDKGILLGNSNNNLLSSNIASNANYGIELSDSSDNVLVSNTASNNRWSGISLWNSNSNVIYHNNFVDNIGWQAYLPTYPKSYNNTWDDGYPSGGNYWSDYTGVDADADGIGDTPYIIDATNRDRYPLMHPWSPPPPSYTLTVYSSPTGVTFTVDDISSSTPWSGTYSEGASVSLVMPEIHTVGAAKYYWNQWSDGVTTRSRTVTMNTNITLTAQYTGPYYQLTVTSSPITGITFTINGVPKTTPYTEWLLEDSYTLEMPQTYNGYVWSRWLEDGDTNRIKTIILSGTTWTGVFVPAPKPRPVGGYSILIQTPTTEKTSPLYLAIMAILTAAFTTVRYKTHKRRKQPHTLFSLS